MSRNILVINVDLRETRVALIEDGVIAELQIERTAHRGSVGNIVLGKVSRVLPGMQAAFIDIGMDRAAFLHVEDLIRPDDFEAYLADKSNSGEDDRDTTGRGSGSGRRTTHPSDDADEDEDSSPEASDDEVASDEHDGDDEEAEEASGSDASDDSDNDDPEDSTTDDPPDDSRGNGNDSSGEGSAQGASDTSNKPEEGTSSSSTDDRSADDDSVAAGTTAKRKGRGRRRRAGGRAKNDKGAQAQKRGGKNDKNVKGDKNGDKGNRRRKDSRVSRSVPITEVVKEGDEVVVQVSKEPIGTKGARVTSHVSLPGRHVVYLPTVDHIGISKRIGSAKERARLKKVIDTIKPPKGGLIVRTVAEGLTKKQLKADIGYLVKVWEEVSRKHEGAKAPAVLYTELDLVLKIARDYFTDEIDRIVIDDKEQYARLVRFVEMFMPERANAIELYSGNEPIFDAYGIEDEIGRALSRKVPLASGGYLIIDQAEALTAIDVNTGRFVGKGSKDLEETALKTNLEAVDEIAYQLRFRNIGGLVILDLIDMERADNRHKVWRSLETHLAKDKAKTTLNRISELGLIEMTRKRTRESLGRLLNEPCFYCDGTGQIQSRETIAFEILRQIRRERESLPGYSVVVNAHPAVIDLMETEEKDAVAEAERRFMRRIELRPRPEFHIEQYDLQGK